MSGFGEPLGNTISEKSLYLLHFGLDTILITAGDQKYPISGRVGLFVVARLISTFRCQICEHPLDKGNIFDALFTQLLIRQRQIRARNVV
jgi:hypothetical protein